MNVSTLVTLTALAFAGVASSNSSAETFDFTYFTRFNRDNVLTGSLEGTLQPDGNTVFVTAVTEVRLNGVPGPQLPYLRTIYGEYGKGALVTIDGSLMDILAADLGVPGQAFLISTEFEHFDLFQTTPLLGSAYEVYTPLNWRLRKPDDQEVEVPDAGSTLGLLAFACGRLFWRGLRLISA